MPKMWTFRADLDRAGIPLDDERGRKVCFHSVRVTFGAWLAAAGTPPRTHMELMRHTSLTMTMQYYTNRRLLDTRGALADLPELGARPEAEPAALRATGTEGGGEWRADLIARDRCSDRSEGAATGRKGGRDTRRNARKPQQNGGFRMREPGLNELELLRRSSACIG
jgi:hypothetical protein